MAIQDNGTRNQYTATASQTVFAYTFEVFDSTDLTVEQNGAVITTYTVSGVGVDAGGNVTLTTGATAGDIITIYRSMSLVRTSDYAQNGEFLADELNTDLDRIIAMIQQSDTTNGSAIRALSNDTALDNSNTTLANVATRAGKSFGFDSNGLIEYKSVSVVDGDTKYTTKSIMEADTGAVVGTTVYVLSDRANGIFDTVTVGTTPNVDLPNGYNIIVSTADATKCFVLRRSFMKFAACYGVTGDGVDSTLALQAVNDYGLMGTIVELPPGTIKVSKQTSTYCINMTRNISFVGSGVRGTSIRADVDPADTTVDIFSMNVTDNGGLLDIRGQSFSKVLMFFNLGGGRDCIRFASGISQIKFKLEDVNLTAVDANNGYCVRDEAGILSFCNFIYSTFSEGMFFNGSADGLNIAYNTFFGNKTAIIMDVLDGTHAHYINNNVIVNRDGALHVINGSQIIFNNNQVEQQGVNANLASAHIVIEGRDSECESIQITGGNNFGGGTNVNTCIYIDNATGTVIENNTIKACATLDLQLTANSKRTFFHPRTNAIRGTISDPRPEKTYKAVNSDLGEGNMGIEKTMAHSNGWTGGTYIKDFMGVVTITGQMTGGTNTSGTVVATLPVGFRPEVFTTMNVSTAGGAGILNISDTTGEITIGTTVLPSTSRVGAGDSFICVDN